MKLFNKTNAEQQDPTEGDKAPLTPQNEEKSDEGSAEATETEESEESSSPLSKIMDMITCCGDTTDTDDNWCANAKPGMAEF
jgi:hypothetical protein